MKADKNVTEGRSGATKPIRRRHTKGAFVQADNGDRIIFADESDERVLDRLAELLDRLFADGAPR
jgi:hypothetical protein